MSNTIYLFRHGLATKSMTGYGDTIKTATLLPEGIEHAKKIGEYLKEVRVDAFYSSEYPRCQQTSEIVGGIIGTAFATDSRLNEYYEIPFLQFVNQIKDFLQSLQKEENQTILICTHAADIAVIHRMLLDVPIEEKDLQTNSPLPGTLEKIEGNLLKVVVTP